MADFKYKRVLLKLSGEALANQDGHGLDEAITSDIASEIKKITDGGVEVAVVVGGGNIIRGANQDSMDREKADYMGMTATIINALALGELFKKFGLNTKVYSAIAMDQVVDTYDIEDASKHLSNGEVVILGGGTGKPFVTTDTTATLRARELGCDCVLKATKVDGVYDSDPVKNKDAKKFDSVSFDESLKLGLKVMDEKAFEMAKESQIPIIVFNMFDKDNIVKVLQGENVGTVIS